MIKTFFSLLVCLSNFILLSNDLVRYYNGEIQLSKEQIHKLCQNIQDSKSSNYLLSLSHFQLAILSRNENHDLKAYENYSAAFEYLTKSDTSDCFLQSAILRNQGAIFSNYGFIKEAILFHEKALVPAFDYSVSRGLSVKHNLGRIYAKIDQEKALEIFLEALKEAEDESLENRQASLHISIGLILMESTAYQKAIDYFNKAINSTSSHAIHARALHNISEVHLHKNDLRKQEEFLIKSLELKDGKSRFHSLIHLGQCYIEQGNDKAKEVLQEALNYYHQQSLSTENIKVFKLLEKAQPNSTKYFRTMLQEYEKLAIQLEKLSEVQKKLTFKEAIGRIESEKEKKKKVGWYKMWAIVGGVSAILIMLTWKIWWYRLRKKLAQKILAIMDRWDKEDSVNS